MAPQGRLILSGILQEQTQSVIEAYQKAIRFSVPVQQEDWILLSGTKN
ncbi:MAG: 50S ribosomal protein L11 methyltransferase [Methylosarcina sp.]